MNEIGRVLYEKLKVTLDSGISMNYDGLFVVIADPYGLNSMLYPWLLTGYSNLVEKIYRIAGLEIPPNHSDNIPISISEGSIDYVLGKSFNENFFREHGIRSNPYHDGALVYIVSGDHSDPRLVLASVLFHLPPNNLIRRNGSNGGRFDAALRISAQHGIICCGIIGNNKGPSVHIFEHGEETTSLYNNK
ncbi:MAG: hypothetical protein QW474_02535 [Candidatus Aenigmatarchaeota archaeon]